MIEACPGLDINTIFADWDTFEKAGEQFNSHLGFLRDKGFTNLQRFWAINISDKDMNTLHTLAPAIYSYGGRILEDRLWWKQVGINTAPALDGIKKLFFVAKQVGLLEECTFGELLNRFHSGHYAVVFGIVTWLN